MTTLVEYLRRFNRKERFYLVGWALGRQAFELDDAFRKSLAEETGLEIPSDAFVAMDYHLNWIHAAIHLMACGCGKDVHENSSALVVGKSTQMIEGNQEDIDLVVAFASDGAYRLIAIEAKGDSPWDRVQLERKVQRLDNTLRGSADGSIDPYLVLASPKRPSNIDASKWPTWATEGGSLRWIRMPWPPLQTVFRCDENGKKSSQSRYWSLR